MIVMIEAKWLIDDQQLPLNNKIIEIMATMPMMTDEAMMMMTAKENQGWVLSSNMKRPVVNVVKLL